MFRNKAFYYQEDLIYMPSIAFNYYARVFAKYVLSDNAMEDSDGTSSFLHMVIELLKDNRSLTTDETEQILLDASKTVANRQYYYDADTDIYREFSELYSEIVQLSAGT